MSDAVWNAEGSVRCRRHQIFQQAKGGPTQWHRSRTQTGIEAVGHRIVVNVARAEADAQFSTNKATGFLETGDGASPIFKWAMRCPNETRRGSAY